MSNKEHPDEYHLVLLASSARDLTKRFWNGMADRHAHTFEDLKNMASAILAMEQARQIVEDRIAHDLVYASAPFASMPNIGDVPDQAADTCRGHGPGLSVQFTENGGVVTKWVNEGDDPDVHAAADDLYFGGAVTSPEYEIQQARLPEGWYLWGNYGDGRWRTSAHGASRELNPPGRGHATMSDAVDACLAGRKDWQSKQHGK